MDTSSLRDDVTLFFKNKERNIAPGNSYFFQIRASFKVHEGI